MSSPGIRENIPSEVPSSSVPIGRELGILFGFLLASVVIMTVYAVIWRGEILPFLSYSLFPPVVIPISVLHSRFDLGLHRLTGDILVYLRCCLVILLLHLGFMFGLSHTVIQSNLRKL
ncbi:hypothetical protein BDW62DRAFT_195060 [Aspergillus aurantiobrunneus]